jgi:hypothetical protein
LPARSARFDQQRITVDGATFDASGIYADPDLFNIMTFPSSTGDAVMPCKATRCGDYQKNGKNALWPGKIPLWEKTIVFNKHHTFLIAQW